MKHIWMIGALALMCWGCNGGGEQEKSKTSQVPETKQKYDTGLKDLVKEDVVIGKATRFQPKMKPVAAGDAIWVLYRGTFVDGKEFDGNFPKDHPEKWPLTFTIGEGAVIRGWDEGFLGMMPGGRRKLKVPWRMAYGETASSVIPAKSDLFFDVELLDVVKAGEATTVDKYDERLGTGAVAAKGKTVTAHFTITATGGKVLEDTWAKKKPETFTLGQQMVQAGFEFGILGMKAGGIRHLRLPPAVGFTVPGDEQSEPPLMPTYVKVQLLTVR